MSQWDKLARQLRGELILPGQDRYDEVRRWFIATLDEVLPAAVARCATAHDVAAAIRFARDRDLPFALRCGGNSTAGHSATAGLLIDFAAFDRVEPDGFTVTVGAGVRTGQLNRALAPTGRLVPLAWMPTVGVAGSALGGGFGPLSRRFGLTCDQLVRARAVLADGRIVTAGAEEHPDLWWALRGAGGGNLAAVTTITMGTHKAVPATDFALRWDPAHATGVADAWQRWAPHTIADLNAQLVLQAPANLDDPPTLVLFGLITGAETAARKEIDDFIDAVGVPPVHAAFTPLPAEAVTTGYNFGGEAVGEAMTGGRPAGFEPGYRVIKSEFYPRPLPRDTIGELVEWLLKRREPGQHRELEFVAWPGGLHGVPVDGSAFVHRTAPLLINHVSVCVGSRAAKLAARRWATAAKAIAAPYGNGHVYQNYPDVDLVDGQNAYYGSNLARLSRVRAEYDPDGVFTGAATRPRGPAERWAGT